MLECKRPLDQRRLHTVSRRTCCCSCIGYRPVANVGGNGHLSLDNTGHTQRTSIEKKVWSTPFLKLSAEKVVPSGSHSSNSAGNPEVWKKGFRRVSRRASVQAKEAGRQHCEIDYEG
jgi:hypothetical protein